jgi:hypothetical protein
MIMIGLLVLLASMFAISLLAGRVWLPVADVWHGLSAPQGDLAAAIVTQLRLPRAVLALEAGAALGLSGAVLQGVTRNPLAEPGLLGVSAGAALGAVLAIYFGLATHFAPAAPMAGLAGALLASMLTFALGSGGGTITLVLAGAAVSAFAAAGISLALNLAPNPYAAYEIMTWLMGSLADRSWFDVILVSPFIVLGAAMLLAGAQLGDRLARPVPAGGIRDGVQRRCIDGGNGSDRLHRPGSAAFGTPAGGVPAQPRAHARCAGRCAAAAHRRRRDPLDSNRRRAEAGRLDQLDRHPVLLLAGRAPAQAGAVILTTDSDTLWGS